MDALVRRIDKLEKRVNLMEDYTKKLYDKHVELLELLKKIAKDNEQR